MNRTRYIFRGTLLLVIVFLLINLYRSTDDNLARIAKFKLETLNKIKNDTLDTKQRLDTLVSDQIKFNKLFIENSPPVKEGLLHLIGAVAILIAVELGFFIADRRRTE